MPDYNIITRDILAMASTFGFLEANIAKIAIDEQTQTNYRAWLQQNFQGDMDYLAQNTQLRFQPEILFNGTISIICVKAPYLTQDTKTHIKRLDNPDTAYVSSYALGRDYHKVVKLKLKAYATAITEYLSKYTLNMQYRVFTDSAPILEVELAQSARLGWRGKNTLLLNKTQGSMFFLGEIFTNLPLVTSISANENRLPHYARNDNIETPIHQTTSNDSKKNLGSCGSCTKCMEVCPTQAFTAPYILNASRCISYLTIEHHGSIPLEFRRAIGNRIYGCDDCQLFCPWNKFAQLTTYTDFDPRHNLDSINLIQAFNLSEEEWKTIMAGSPIYRIGYDRWLRNVAIALGNAPTTAEVINALLVKQHYPNAMVQEHVVWALEQHTI